MYLTGLHRGPRRPFAGCSTLRSGFSAAIGPGLLIDEPFDGLDLRQGRGIGGALRDHARAGRTMFLSIHQIQDAARVCDRFVLLSAGTVRGEGTLDELRGRVRSPVAPHTETLEEVFLALT